LLYELEPSRESFALCSKPLLMTLLPASVLVSLFVWPLPFDLSSKGGPASSYATADIALRVTSVLKTPHHDKVEAPMRKLQCRKHHVANRSWETAYKSIMLAKLLVQWKRLINWAEVPLIMTWMTDTWTWVTGSRHADTSKLRDTPITECQHMT